MIQVLSAKWQSLQSNNEIANVSAYHFHNRESVSRRMQSSGIAWKLRLAEVVNKMLPISLFAYIWGGGHVCVCVCYVCEYKISLIDCCC